MLQIGSLCTGSIAPFKNRMRNWRLVKRQCAFLLALAPADGTVCASTTVAAAVQLKSLAVQVIYVKALPEERDSLFGFEIAVPGRSYMVRSRI